MRNYNKADMLRIVRFAKENGGLKPFELIKAYDKAYPELTAKEKLINLSRALEQKGLYKALTGEDLPE